MINGVSLGSLGTAAMAYVSHITNHPKLCMFFLVVGIVGVVTSILGEIVIGLVKAEKKD